MDRGFYEGEKMPTQIYRTKDGQRVPSVTTVLGVLAKNALTYWGYSVGLQNFERVSALISSLCSADLSGKSADELSKKIISQLREFQIGPLYEKRDRAAEAGTLAHSYVEHHLKGLPDPSVVGIVEPIVKKAEGCYVAYLEWERSHKFKMVHSELSLVSNINGFGGTLDIGAVLGEMCIVDIKTSKAIYPASMLPQISAYAHLYNENYENKIKGFHIIRLGEEGDFEHRYWPELDDAWEIFLNCLNIYKKVQKNGWKL